MKMFSKEFQTFEEWLVSNLQNTDYKRRILRLHTQHPNASLAQLRGHAKTGERPIHTLEALEKSKRSWFTLNPNEKLTRDKSLKVLSDVRRNKKSLTQAAKEKGISLKTVIHNTGAFKKQGNRWIAKAYNRIPRVLKINENGKTISIEVKDSRTASLIGRYHNAVKRFLETGDDSELHKFKGKMVKDSQGRKHSLETESDALEQINEGIEEPEFYDIYSE